MAFSKIIYLLIIGYSIAAPLKPDSTSGLIFGLPVSVEDSSDLQNELKDQFSPILFFYLPNGGNLEDTLSEDSLKVEKRSVEGSETDDLETAAGTNALRPLFVYRQQVAYRQRVRDAIRRRNRF